MFKRHLYFLSILFAFSAQAKTVSLENVRIVADNYFTQYSGKKNPVLSNSFSVIYNGMPVYYVYNYAGGGYVVVSADDAVIPVLAQSNEGYVDKHITNPATKYWFDSYSKEIGHIVASGADNTETLIQWNRIRNNEFEHLNIYDAGPLLTTTWDQGEYYNYYCPADAGGPGGHVWAGCVATAMAQVMKYYDFPEKGFLSHSYNSPYYGMQSVNFGVSAYNWASMENSANSASFLDIATLIYHAGVSVEMDYRLTGSGASYEAVKWALSTYFNYDPITIKVALKADYTEVEWKELLKTDIHSFRPVVYGGDSDNGSHAWVCDGWRWIDDMFHMNWGWSGNYNGWFWIGALNTSQGYFNQNNTAITGIIPGNPDLVVRITNLMPNQLIDRNSTLAVNCSVVKGIPETINLYVDENLVNTVNQATITFNLPLKDYVLGNHTIKVEAINSTDTSYHQVTIRNSEWISQASAFETPSRGIMYLHAVDSLVAWATAYDGINVNNPVQEFTRTVNGGETWLSGTISGCEGLAPSMIFALNADIAYCPMYWVAGSNQKGIYSTADGGLSWNRQAGALFSDPASFPNVVHFFDNSNGFCAGDPVGGEYEIYITDNGGLTWNRVAADSIPNPVFGEVGVIGYYSAYADNAWFGTNNGKVYRTTNKGKHWAASSSSLSGKFVDVEFADSLHGLAQDKNTNSQGALSESFDGGISWTHVNPIGPVGITDFCFVPGTENTWVSTNAKISGGVYYSFDGGHSWAPLDAITTLQYLAVDFVNNSCGWSGTFNTSATAGGMYKYVGNIPASAALSPVNDLVASIAGSDVHLEWTAPASGIVLGYNVYRNDTLLNPIPLTAAIYSDNSVTNGHHMYCVKAVYTTGESVAVCTKVSITYGIAENEVLVRVYPNPANEMIHVEVPGIFSQVKIYSATGKEVYTCNTRGKMLKILTAGFKPGVYILKVSAGEYLLQSKIIIL